MPSPRPKRAPQEKFLKVHLYFRGEDDEPEEDEGHLLGVWRGLACGAQEALDKAKDELWDERLTTASCLAFTHREEVGRYVVREGLSLGDGGSRPVTVRGVWDRGIRAFAVLQQQTQDGRWQSLLGEQGDVAAEHRGIAGAAHEAMAREGCIDASDWLGRHTHAGYDARAGALDAIDEQALFFVDLPDWATEGAWASLAARRAALAAEDAQAQVVAAGQDARRERERP